MATSSKEGLLFLDQLLHRVKFFLPGYQDNDLEALFSDTDLFIRKVFPKSEYTKTLKDIIFDASIHADNSAMRMRPVHSLKNLLKTMKNELEWFNTDADSLVQKSSTDTGNEQNNKSEKEVKALSNEIFIVHGHDNELQIEVARTIEKLGLVAVILHERENQGLTVIEKFESNALNCDFAVVLLTPDDKGYSIREGEENARLRARQNVVLELGYFIGKLGRSNVLPLVKHASTDDLEIPSDLAGIVYTPYDASGAWKMKLIGSLRSAGFDVDANKLY